MAVTWSNLAASWQNIHYEYRCLSTDTKPTDAPVNSTLRELDTGASYYFSDGEWKLAPAQASGAASQSNTQSSAASAQQSLIVTFTEDQEEIGYVGDKTFKQVYDAFHAGAHIVCTGIGDSVNAGSVTFCGFNYSENKYDIEIRNSYTFITCIGLPDSNIRCAAM